MDGLAPGITGVAPGFIIGWLAPGISGVTLGSVIGWLAPGISGVAPALLHPVFHPGIVAFSLAIASSCPRYKVSCEADRKSTRLNSSHANISYAVFCLKKKKRIEY